MDDAGFEPVDARAPSLAGTGFMFRAGLTAMSNELKFEAAKSLRTAFVVLASLNAVAAAATAVGIFWDCYVGASRTNPAFGRPSLLRAVGPIETFPLILSCGIVIQSIMFAVAQSKGLEGLLVLGCTPASQLMLPALFLVPYIQLVFGIETTARALRRRPFPERPRWAVPVCLGAVAAGLIGTYIVTRIILPPNFCFAELMWLVQRWSEGCFGMLLAIALALLLGSLVIFFQLYRTWGVADVQRVAASWTACYMVLAVVITVVMISFFATASGKEAGIVYDEQIELSAAAAVVANLSGFLTGGLYLLLRCTRLGRLGCRGYFEFDRQKPRMDTRTMTPSNLMYTKQMERPVSPVLLEWMKKKADRLDEVKMEEEQLSSSSSSSTPTTKGPEEKGPGAARGPGRGPRAGNADAEALVASTLSPDVLLPPTAVWTARRERNSSLGSSATVQIGLRVSNINDMPPGTSYYERPSRSEPDRPETYGIGSYYEQPGRPEPARPGPDRPETYGIGSYYEQPRRPEPDRPETYGLAISTDELSPVVSGGDDVDKQRPPVPVAVKDARARDEPSDDETKLSPTVYSPQKPSPTKSKSRGPPSPPRAPPPGPGRSTSDRPGVQSGAWI